MSSKVNNLTLLIKLLAALAPAPFKIGREKGLTLFIRLTAWMMQQFHMTLLLRSFFSWTSCASGISFLVLFVVWFSAWPLLLCKFSKLNLWTFACYTSSFSKSYIFFLFCNFANMICGPNYQQKWTQLIWFIYCFLSSRLLCKNKN